MYFGRVKFSSGESWRRFLLNVTIFAARTFPGTLPGEQVSQKFCVDLERTFQYSLNCWGTNKQMGLLLLEPDPRRRWNWGEALTRFHWNDSEGVVADRQLNAWTVTRQGKASEEWQEAEFLKHFILTNGEWIRRLQRVFSNVLWDWT